MRLLFLLPYCPVPADSGNKILTSNLLTHVTRHSSCDVALLVDNETDEEVTKRHLFSALPDLRAAWIFRKRSGIGLHAARLAALMGGNHPGLGRYSSDGLSAWLEEHLRNHVYDLIHFDMLPMVQYRSICKSNRSLLVASDAYSLAARRAGLATRSRLRQAKALIDHLLIRRYERRYYGGFDVVCVVSRTDQSYLKGIVDGVNVEVIGVPLGEEFARTQPRQFTRENQSGAKLLCAASVSHFGVAEGIRTFLEKGYERVRESVPGVTLTLLGRKAAKSLARCARRMPSITVLEYVPDYCEFVQQDWVYVFPQRCATGLQNRIQQAMAVGVPVVGYPVAFEGLDVEDGRDCFICNTEEQLCNSVVRLLKDRSLRESMGFAAAKHVRAMFSRENVGRHVMNIYRRTINDGSKTFRGHSALA